MKRIIAALLVFVCLCQLSINTNAVDVSPISSSDGVTVSVNNSKKVVLENNYIAVTVNKVVGLTSITDKRTGHEWNLNHEWAATGVNSIEVVGKVVKLDVFLGSIQKNAYSEITLSETKPEVTLTLSCDDNSAMPNGAFYPEPFLTNKETKLIMPKQEGMMVQANDDAYPEFAERCYAGGSLSMPFYGLIDHDSSMMAIIDTPDDAVLWLNRKVGSDGLLKINHQWDPQKGNFGYQRQLTFVFFDSGSIVPMAKRYRDEAIKLGYYKTLLEKKETDPNIDRLVGAADIWFNLGVAEEKFLSEVQKAGFKRFIWNGSAGTQMSMSKPTYLSLLDQGILIPRFHSSMIVNPNATSLGTSGYTSYIYKKAWDKDLVYNQDGSIYSTYFPNDGRTSIETGYLCDVAAMKYVEETQASQSKIYNANFMDGATNQPFLECYNADHPMTRTQSKLAREKWLDACSYGDTMVIGSENGIYNMVPYADYLEGMMSIGSFRDPEAGSNNFKIVSDPSKALTDYELGQKYRIPLWELVFHDCSVSYWYWGDSSNIYPSFFQKRDLFNILYGTPPLYTMSLNTWDKMKDQFVSSYNNVTPVARAVGYAEMTNFEYLTENMDVQSTTFSNGVKVIVNFGDTDYTDSDGSVINSMDYKASGIQPETEPTPSPSPSATIATNPSATAAVPPVTVSDDEASTNENSAKVNWILPIILGAGLIICVVAVVLVVKSKKRNSK